MYWVPLFGKRVRAFDLDRRGDGQREAATEPRMLGHDLLGAPTGRDAMVEVPRNAGAMVGGHGVGFLLPDRGNH